MRRRLGVVGRSRTTPAEKTRNPVDETGVKRVDLLGVGVPLKRVRRVVDTDRDARDPAGDGWRVDLDRTSEETLE